MYNAHNFQKSIYDRLQADGVLMALISGIYDQVQSGTKLPYAVFSVLRVSDWSSATSSGVECLFAVQCFSRQGGARECSQVLKRVQELLHGVALTLPAPDKLVLMYFVDSSARDNGQNYQETSRFRALIQVS